MAKPIILLEPAHTNVPTFLTIGTGLFVSTALGCSAGWAAEWLVLDWWRWDPMFDLPSFWIPFGSVFGGVLIEGLRKGHIPTAHEGVVELLGTRQWWLTLKEGRHWVFPGFMSLIPVDVSILTNNKSENPPIEISALSSDGVMMRALIVMQYQVVNVVQSLGVGGAISSLRAMAESQVRAVFGRKTSRELESADVKGDLGDLIKQEIDEHDYEYGLNVSKIFEPEILPPQEIIDANARLREEQAQAASEQYELTKRRERAAELQKDGLSATLAYEVLLTEAGKMASSTNVNRMEGIEKPVAIASAAIVKVAKILAVAIKKG